MLVAHPINKEKTNNFIMQNYSNILQPNRTRADLDSGSKKRVIQDCARLISSDYPKISEQELFDQLMERERLGSTGLGEGVAIPHCGIDLLPKVMGAFVTLANAVDFEAEDKQPVDLIFLLVVPNDETDAHLDILSQCAEIFQNADTRQTLRSITDDKELYETMISLLGG